MLSSTLEIYSNSKLIREVSPNPTPNHVHSPITDFNHLSDRSFLLCLSLNCSSRTRSSTISFSKLVPRKSRSRSVSISQLVSSSTSFLISLSLSNSYLYFLSMSSYTILCSFAFTLSMPNASTDTLFLSRHF